MGNNKSRLWNKPLCLKKIVSHLLPKVCNAIILTPSITSTYLRIKRVDERIEKSNELIKTMECQSSVT
ncbi:hypothetical protein L2E82_51692 [Cichorium intybus]|nr:hypothetical protein L2E82_51692 [Cichorium intybus]